MASTVHQKLEKTRKPRVHITYDVEVNDKSEKRELPFITGVMGDFAGNAPTVDKKRLKDRNFVEIDGDNFGDVMKKMGPGVNMNVKNMLTGDGDKEMNVELAFKSMDDFKPENIAKQVEPLRQLLETRAKLEELLSKADRSEKLEEVLENVLQNTEQLQSLAKDLGTEGKE
tara:strand:+ start:97316 stop:97828 length:513 start_codon:yes stop_codon:yes gene_type:complete